MNLKTFVSLCLCGSILRSVPARAIELSLEENRAERGSVGYVDMQRLFKASPDAAKAREGLEELVRQAEERVNAKKAEMLRTRQDIEALKLERDELAKSTPIAAAPAPVPQPAPVPTPPPVEAPKPKPAPAPAPAPVTAAPPPAAPDVSTKPAPGPLMINLPGMTEGPKDLALPGSSPLNPTKSAQSVATEAPAPVPETPPAPAPEPAPEPAAAEPVPPPAAEPIPAGPTLAQRLLEFDGRIVAKQAEYDRLQGELDRERLGSERSLVDAEGRKTDQVLARLYRAISEVAKRESVSVVVDKSATLYGHPAVDLTDKVLKQLRGAIPPQ